MQISRFGKFLGAAVLAAMMAVPAMAQQSRRIETARDSDYFGFDLRSEKNVSLEQCQSICLADTACKAFTYNPKAQWCFLKSDFKELKPFAGAIAGKVVEVAAEPEIGAPGALTFLPGGIANEAVELRALVTGPSVNVPPNFTRAALISAGDQTMAAGDSRNALVNYTMALHEGADDSALWNKFARANVLALQQNQSDRYRLRRDATGAAYNAYQLSRTTSSRAAALATLAVALDQRDYSRPALQAYEASLGLQQDAAIRAEYEDLKARKGFRVLEHTVNADAADPNVCIQLSEDLVKSGVDYGQFVSVDNSAPKSVEASTRQICVGGLEYGRNYKITFRQGIPSQIGEVTQAPTVLGVYMPDRTPSVRFTGNGFVLPAAGRRGVPLVTVNMNAAKLNLYRVGDRNLAQLLSGYQFLNQLDGYDVSTISDQLGEPVWEGEIDVANQLNKEVATSFPVDEAIPERKPGVYVLTAATANSESYDTRATQWFVVSDIGLSTLAGQDGLHVFARSLSTAKPLANVEVTLLAKNNEILGAGRTDAQGKVTFNPGSMRGENAAAPAVLTAKAGEDDFVFLDMAKAGFDLSDRGVEGRPAPGPLDIYLFTERGIYRAGDTVHVSALARNDAAKAVDPLPLTFIFSRPDGVEDRRMSGDGANAGGYNIDLALSANAMRGTWRVDVHTDPKQPAIASKAFLVEDFVPDRIEFTMAADKPEIARDETAEITVDGRFLYGAPAAGLTLEGDVRLATTRESPAYKGYVFGLADESQGDAVTQALEDLPAVGDDGKATFPVGVDNAPATTRLVKAGVTVRMRESGGRAVEEKLDIAVRPSGDMIGIRPDFSGDAVPEGGAAGFSVIAIDENGRRIAADGLVWSLTRLDREYQWFRSDSRWNYEAVTIPRPISDGKLDVPAGDPARISMPVDWGRYRLQVEKPDGTAVSSVEFNGGWYVEAASTETPDGLEIALDKPQYAPGDVAKLNVSPRFAGELLVNIGAERLLKTISVSVPKDGAVVDIPVEADWGGGAYVTATLFRPGEGPESRMPARAIGLKWLKIDPKDKQFSVKLGAPEKSQPNQTLTVPVEVTGAKGQDAWVTVAAVDVGILNLTNYKAPDPVGYYFGQRRLGLEMRDIYGRLIDGSQGAAGRIRTGGDGSEMAAQGSPPQGKLVAQFSGPVKLDADGKASVSFDIPQFNGTVRLMAVAWSKDGVGNGVQDAIVRDPVVVTAGLPRFMAPGDRAEMRLDIANTDAPDGDYALTVNADPNILVESDEAPKSVSLVGGKRQSIVVPLVAGNPGQSTVTVTLAKEGGPEIRQVLDLPIRASQPPMTTRLVVDLGPNSSMKVDRELLAASLMEGATVSVGVSPSAALDVPSLLMTLDRYPYGCAEQTTSRALPLLYVNEMAAGEGMRNDPDLKKRVQDAVYKVLNNQSSTGSFGLWGPGSGDLWLDAYVTDFLTRAREQDYDVPRAAMLQALNNLQNGVGIDADVEERGSALAYALYVLARNKRAAIGDLRYFLDTKLEAFTSPMAVAQLGAALALYGETERSGQAFQAAFALAQSQPEHDWNRSDYGSRLRDGAAMLALAAESKPAPAVLPELIRYVAAERPKARWTSTQDEAWMLLAARGLKTQGDNISLNVNGAPQKGVYSARFTGEEVAASPVTVANTGADAIQAVVTTVASPREPLPAAGDGFTIKRTYYTLDGQETNVTETKQNERYVVVLNITEQNAWPSRVLVADLLPAGFEIDNPGLVSSAELSNFDWLPQTQAAHLEFRNDRFIAAFDRSGSEDRSIALAYVVRAVTPGTYALPPATVEDMYRPQFSARTATGMMEVR